jgi:TonB family protein
MLSEDHKATAAERVRRGLRHATAPARRVIFRTGRAARMNGLIVWWVVVGILIAGPVAAQHESGRLAAARNLYVSARYEEALEVLDALRGDAHPDRKSVEKYRSLCLLALGRAADAERAIAAVVTADPTYQPDEAEASPRVRATFAEVRRQLLPGIATARYVAAKATYDRREWAAAAEQFQLVLALIDDPDTGGRLADLRLLAAGFLELSAQAALPVPPRAEAEPPSPVPSVETPVEADPDRIYGAIDDDVTPPVALRQDLPKVPSGVTATAKPRGLVEIVIDEQGRVISMAIRESIQPAYDLQILAAARDWKYEPATRLGRPVRFRKLIQITVTR